MNAPPNKALPVLLAGVLSVTALLPPGEAFGQNVTSDQVKEAVRKGLANIRRQQQNGGTWRDHGGHKGGVTALALLAMLNAGVPPEDPDVARGLAALAKVENAKTYVVSLKAQAFAAAYEAAAGDNPDLETYHQQVLAAADWLAKAQNDNGMWGYGNPSDRGSGRGDNSNTQFALLGLHEAARLHARPPHKDVEIPKEVWERSRGHFENTQTGDGAWGYRGKSGVRGSMTVAAIASLYICGLRLHEGGPHEFVDGAYPDCGRYTQNVVLAKGLEWMAKHFTVTSNPGSGNTWHHYYLYGMERVGMVSGKRNFGLHDWYREGSAHLVATQGLDGNWGNQLFKTCFSVLFLAKGNRPVLIQKVQWVGHWNRNIHDLENLTDFIGEKLGKRTTWQTTSLALPVEELRVSPILFITGHEFPEFTDEQRDKLVRYVRAGGTLLFEACCAKREFAEGFRAFARKAWPEYPVRNIDATGPRRHPVWDSYYRYDEHFKPIADDIGENYGLQGIDVGCRTSVFFSPRALSCLWELQDIPKWSDFAYKLATNIAAYATGREQLANKLDAVELPADTDDKQRHAEMPRGAVRIARLIHDGECNADPHAMVNLALLLRDKAKVDVVARDKYLAATDEALFEYPVIFMNGHHSFELKDQEIERLRLYLRRGGTIVASSCCGRDAFDKSFREMVRKLYPEGTKDASGNAVALNELPRDHPVIAGKIGTKLGELRYRKVLAEELKRKGVGSWRGTTHPPIEAVTIDGRTVILYSKYDFCCALEGDRPYACRGYIDDDGRRLALNLFLYAISY